MANRIVICLNGELFDRNASKRMVSKFMAATDIIQPNPKSETDEFLGEKVTYYWFYTTDYKTY